MKFDLVLANPPYQGESNEAQNDANTTNSSNLWKPMVEMATRICPDGDILVICPSAWMNGVKGKDTRKVLSNYGLKTIVEVDAKKAFPTVGIRSGVSYFHAEAQYKGDVEIQSLDGGVYTDVSRHSTIFSFYSPEDLAYANKFKQTDFQRIHTSFVNNKYTRDVGTRGSLKRLCELNNTYSMTQDEVFKTKVLIFSESKSKPAKYLYSKEDHTNNMWGLVIPILTGTRWLGILTITPPGVGAAAASVGCEAANVAVYFKTEAEALNAKAFYESDEMRRVIHITKWKNLTNSVEDVYNYMPMLDFTRAYSSEDITNLFGL